jgi:uncharacterized membrane protein SirB2
MIEHYPVVRALHIASVFASGALFCLRGIGLQVHASWPMARPTRYLSYSIDTVLLAAALMLCALLHQYPFVHAWLTAKVVLLGIYIVLGRLRTL